MRDLIILTSHVDDAFFENEIDYAKEYFNVLAIVSYGEDRKKCAEVLKRHGLDPAIHHVVPSVPLSMVKLRINPFKILLRLLRPEVRLEISKNIIGGKLPLKRLKSLLHYIGYGLEIEKLFKKLNLPDRSPVIYSYWLAWDAYAACRIKEAFFPESPVVSRAHGFDLYPSRNEANYIPFRSYLNFNLSFISFISSQGMEYFKALFPEPQNKGLFYLGTENKRGFRKRILKKDSVTIASCSNVIGVKRLDLIVEALSRLGGLKVKWVHIGDGKLMEDIKALALRKLPSSVSYEFLGKIPNSRVLETYMDLDVDFLINLSDSEGLPVSLMEAFSLGIPAVARDVGGTREILSQKSGLLLLEPWDQGYFDKIRQTFEIRLKDQDKYADMSKEALKRHRENFDGAGNYRKFFERILTVPSGPFTSVRQRS